MSSRHHRTTTFLTLGFLGICAAAVVLAGPAPVGTYTATMGGTATTTGIRARGRGFRRGRSSTGATSGTQVTISIASYSTSEELDQLTAAQKQSDPGAFVNLLASFDHGTVTIGGASFPINAAYSTGAGTSGNIIYVLSSTPLTSSAVSRRGRRATGTSVGYIRLTVNAAGTGNGVLYSSTQVAVSTDGTFTVKAGGSTATPLSNVTRQ